MAGKLTTHVLDTTHGCPAAGLKIALYELREGDQRTLLKSVITNADGRVDSPLLEGPTMRAGVFELVFQAGEYFRSKDVELPEPPFLDVIPVRFGIADAELHYHVPLLVSPWTYSTYRGS